MYQKTEVIGRLGKDPEMRYSPDGKAVTTFPLATNHKYTTAAGEKRDETTWFRITAWDKLAEVCNQYLSKGDLVFIEGRLQPDKATGNPKIWTGDDGQPRASFEIAVQTIRFLKTKKQAGKENEPQGDAPF